MRDEMELVFDAESVCRGVLEKSGRGEGVVGSRVGDK
jgi:hypothetical protein